MLKVSERAMDVLNGVQQQPSESGEAVGSLRLSKTGSGQYGLVRGEPQDDDQVVKRDEKPILYVDNGVAQSLDGATLDVVETEGQERLTLKPPA